MSLEILIKENEILNEKIKNQNKKSEPQKQSKKDKKNLYKKLEKFVLNSEEDFSKQNEQSFNKEIEEIEIQQEEFYQQRKPLIKSLTKIIQEQLSQINQKIKVQLYGSQVSGLCLQWSDMDLLATIPNTMNDMKNTLSLFQEHLSIFSNIKVIEKSYFPLIKLQTTEKYECQKIDLNICVEGLQKHQGVRCVLLVRQYLIEYKELKSLIIILKQLVFEAGLSDPFYGGISSYGITLIIVSYLQLMERQNIGKTQEKNTFELLKNFLSFFTQQNFSQLHLKPQLPDKQIKDLQESQIIDNKSKLKVLWIQDPLNESNNVARSTQRQEDIRNLFINLHIEMMKQNLKEKPYQNLIKISRFFKQLFEAQLIFSQLNKEK